MNEHLVQLLKSTLNLLTFFLSLFFFAADEGLPRKRRKVRMKEKIESLFFSFLNPLTPSKRLEKFPSPYFDPSVNLQMFGKLILKISPWCKMSNV